MADAEPARRLAGTPRTEEAEDAAIRDPGDGLLMHRPVPDNKGDAAPRPLRCAGKATNEYFTLFA